MDLDLLERTAKSKSSERPQDGVEYAVDSPSLEMLHPSLGRSITFRFEHSTNTNHFMEVHVCVCVCVCVYIHIRMNVYIRAHTHTYTY